MANENKNIHELAAESDEDTSELEILAEPQAADLDYEFEADAATHSFENLDRKHKEESLATLRLQLHDRHGDIGRLEYEIEQIRSRCTGLETELRAREEATGNLLAELADARKALAGVRERIERRDEKVARLEALVQDQEQHLTEAARALEEARRSAQSSEAVRADLERQLREADARIVALAAEAAEERTGHARAREAEQAATRARLELEQHHGEATSLLETLRQYIDGRKAQWEQQDVLLRTKDALLDEQQRRLRQYANENDERQARLRTEQAANEELCTLQAALDEENARLGAELESLNGLLAETEPALAAERQKNEALTARVDELAQSLDAERRGRKQAEAALAGRGRELEALRSELEAAAPAIAETGALAARLEEAASQLASEQAARSGLEARVAALEDELAALRGENEALRRSAAEHEETAAFRLAEIDEMATRLAELSQEHERERNERQSLDAHCNALEEQARRLRAEASAARERADQARAAERESERLSGVVTGLREELRALRERLARNEEYADTLRRKLAAHAAEAENSASGRREVEAALAAAQAKAEGLAADLEEARQRHAELAAGREDDRRRFEEELEKLRRELTTAEETLAENQTLNEQLASDLLETSSFRVALESQLSAADDTFRKQSRELNRELKKLKQQVEDYERKISSKDAAISVLLAELANKPHAAAPDENAPVVHHMADRKPAAAEDRPAPPPPAEKERLARLLIGTVDGQEVRFPLFKNKLTIGRTANNDIQLKAQYISRRHAVVVCDNDNTRIVDWGSKNGIYVNGVRVSEKILKNGDRLTVGTAEFRFEERPKR